MYLIFSQLRSSNIFDILTAPKLKCIWYSHSSEAQMYLTFSQLWSSNVFDVLTAPKLQCIWHSHSSEAPMYLTFSQLRSSNVFDILTAPKLQCIWHSHSSKVQCIWQSHSFEAPIYLTFSQLRNSNIFDIFHNDYFSSHSSEAFTHLTFFVSSMIAFQSQKHAARDKKAFALCCQNLALHFTSLQIVLYFLNHAFLSTRWQTIAILFRGRMIHWELWALDQWSAIP